MTDPSPRVGFFGAAPGATARWQTSVLLWLVLVLSLASLHPVFVGVGWWVAGAVVAGVGWGSGHFGGRGVGGLIGHARVSAISRAK